MKWTIDQPFLLVAVRSYISHGAVACLFLSWCRTDASRVHWSFQLSSSGYVYRVKCTANQYGLFATQCGSTIYWLASEASRKILLKMNILCTNFLDKKAYWVRKISLGKIIGGHVPPVAPPPVSTLMCNYFKYSEIYILLSQWVVLVCWATT